jgi:hypothetical protein
MNDIYVYKYKSTGRQFTSTANPLVMQVHLYFIVAKRLKNKSEIEYPILIGVCKLKEIKKTK